MERPKRILIIGDRQSPLTQERGQVGLKGGYEVFWFSVSREDLKNIKSLLVSAVNCLGRGATFCSPFLLKTFIKRICPDLIHVHYAYQGLNTLLLADFKPLVVTIMGGDVLPEQGFYGVRKWIVKRMLNAADIITSKSRFLDAALNRIGNYEDKIRRVTWGIDMEEFRPGLDVTLLRQKWNIHPQELVFLCPRICDPFYNQHVILEAFAGYLLYSAGTNRKAKLIVSELGVSESYRKQLRNLVDELELTEHVRFVGVIPHSEMPSYFNLANIMVAIPPSDGIPQSLYEAMGCGTFPILGNLPQYHELIKDGVNGKLVTIGEIPALSEAMQWAAVHREQREATARINREFVLRIANKDDQEKLVNAIYEKLFKEYAKKTRVVDNS